MKKVLMLFCASALLSTAQAQCEAGELPFTMDLYTDDWGYEVYWEIVPQGNPCGTGTIASGGNSTEVGCNGGGLQVATEGNGYESNTTVSVGPVCLTIGQSYDIYFVDDYGDGGLTFDIFEDGSIFAVLTGSGDGNMWTITPGFSPIPEYDNPCDAESLESDGTPLLLNNDFALAESDEPAPAGFNCEAYGFWCEGDVTKSVWALATIPDDGAYFITTCNEGTLPDTQVAVYTFTDCADFSTYTLISSNDDIPGGCTNGNGYGSGCYISCLPANTQILVQVDGYFGESGDIVLTLSSFGESATANPIVYDSACPLSKGEPGSGAIFAQISGWGIDYSIEWEGPDGFFMTGQAIFDLSPGTYTYMAVNDCGETFTGSVEVGAAEPFAASVQVTQPTCATATNGSIQLTLTGGTAPYTYSWTGPNGYMSENQNPTGLTAGNYLLNATDENGCTFSQFFTVTGGAGIPVNLGANTTICLNQQLTLSGPSGVAYNWSTGDQSQSITLTGEGLGVGEHTIILNVSDTSGCNGAGSVTITVDNCIGVVEMGLDALGIYPNPAQHILRLTGLPSERVSLTLTAMDGRLVLQQETDGSAVHTMDVDALARGVYVLDIRAENGINVQRKVVME